MKTRIGFVSNSSSTSFMLLCSVENHEKAMAKLDEYETAVIKAMGIETHEFNGKNVVTVGNMGDLWNKVSATGYIETQPKKKKRRSCRHKMIEGAVFCHKCGSQRYFETALQSKEKTWEKYKKEATKGEHVYWEIRT